MADKMAQFPKVQSCDPFTLQFKLPPKLAAEMRESAQKKKDRDFITGNKTMDVEFSSLSIVDDNKSENGLGTEANTTALVCSNKVAESWEDYEDICIPITKKDQLNEPVSESRARDYFIIIDLTRAQDTIGIRCVETIKQLLETRFEELEKSFYQDRCAFFATSESKEETIHKLQILHPQHTFYFLHYPDLLEDFEFDELLDIITRETEWEVVNKLKAYILGSSNSFLWKADLSNEIEILAKKEQEQYYQRKKEEIASSEERRAKINQNERFLGLVRAKLEKGNPNKSMETKLEQVQMVLEGLNTDESVFQQREISGLVGFCSLPILGELSLVDMTIAMVFQNYAILSSQQEHYTTLAKFHEEVREEWYQQFGRLPMPQSSLLQNHKVGGREEEEEDDEEAEEYDNLKSLAVPVPAFLRS